MFCRIKQQIEALFQSSRSLSRPPTGRHIEVPIFRADTGLHPLTIVPLYPHTFRAPKFPLRYIKNNLRVSAPSAGGKNPPCSLCPPPPSQYKNTLRVSAPSAGGITQNPSASLRPLREEKRPPHPQWEQSFIILHSIHHSSFIIHHS